MTASHHRALLDQFSESAIDVDQLAAAAPNCACEAASSPEFGCGQVEDGEQVRFFICSRSDVDLKNKPKLVHTRPFTTASLKKAYKDGLSVCRLNHATRPELNYTANMLFEIHVRKDAQYGGVLGVLDFSVDLVRRPPGNIDRMCVLETPEDPKPDGGFFRPSHADVVFSISGLDAVRQKENRDIFHNVLVKSGIQKRSEDVSDCDIIDFLPKVALDNPQK
jgi:hypothetical protein